MRGLPGRRERPRQHRRSPARCQRSTVAGWTSTSASRHRGHHHRNSRQSRRSEGRKRRFERARTLNWWRRARLSSRRSPHVDDADRTAAQRRETSRIARRVAIGDTHVKGSCTAAILARHTLRGVCRREMVHPSDDNSHLNVQNVRGDSSAGSEWAQDQFSAENRLPPYIEAPGG
jgi:hypothetical protein